MKKLKTKGDVQNYKPETSRGFWIQRVGEDIRA